MNQEDVVLELLQHREQIKIATEGVANFRRFQSEVREFITRSDERDVNRDGKADELIRTVGLLRDEGISRNGGEAMVKRIDVDRRTSDKGKRERVVMWAAVVGGIVGIIGIVLTVISMLALMHKAEVRIPNIFSVNSHEQVVSYMQYAGNPPPQ